MKKATMFLMACMILAGTAFAQREGPASVRVETLNLLTDSAGTEIGFEAQATKLTSPTLASKGEILRVQIEAPGMIVFDDCLRIPEEFPEFEVQVDTTYGHKDLPIGKLALSTFTGQGTMMLVSPYSYNGNQPGELPFFLSGIKSVKVLYQGVTMASGSF
ncbi:MAG: hypothetical protein HY650_03565 [Acidobacteria bacterium]|nr:hypothetical protein [Acidobacteriota bacterium]